MRFLLPLFLAATATLQAQEIPQPLLAAEKARGVLPGGSGVEWTVNVSSNDGKTAQFICTSQSGNVYAVIEKPENAAGNKYIATDTGKMWFWKPALSRPVSVSKRQRLSGNAAIGDIASNSFVEGYKVTGSKSADGATVYTLEADSRAAAYKKIRYWVSKKNLGVKAEFFAASGNLLRTATMDYGNKINGNPFVSQMKIVEPSRTATLKFSNVKIGTFPADLFDVKTLAPEQKRKSPGPR